MSATTKHSKAIPLIGLLPMLGNLLFIVLVCSPVLFYDEWDGFAGILNRVHREGFSFAPFWTAHNEHRIVLSKVIYYVQSFLTTDPRWMMAMSAVVWWLTLLELNRVLKLEPAVEGKLKPILAVVSALFFFSQVQAENFYWGFQLCWIIATFGAVGAITSVIEKRYLRMLVFFAVSYFSLASWPALAATVGLVLLVDWWKTKDTKKLAIMMGFGVLCVVALFVYVQGVSTPQHEKMNLGFFQDPVRFVLFALTLVGVPFAAMGFIPNLLFGLVFLGLLAWIWKKRPQALGRLEFYLILYMLVGALVIAHGRAGTFEWGHKAAFRWATLFMPAWLAFYAVLINALGDQRKPLIVLALVLAVNVWVSDVKGFDHEKGANQSRQQAGECLDRVLAQAEIDFESPDAKCALYLYHTPPVLFATAKEWKERMGRLY